MMMLILKETRKNLLSKDNHRRICSRGKAEHQRAIENTMIALISGARGKKKNGA